MIITLCGSARFEADFKDWNRRLTLSGHVVFSLAVYPSDMGSKGWYTVAQKEQLDRVHKLKINASDAVFIINRNDYVGESTASELAYARQKDKQIFWAYEYNGPRTLRHTADQFIKCPYAGCPNDILFVRPPCALCYE
jgi:hypothetical protein